jgi:hypothetical protein
MYRPELASGQTFWQILYCPSSHCCGVSTKTRRPNCEVCHDIYMPHNRQFVVMITDQVLWFGNNLHCSLINRHHQIWTYRYGVSDDPWDPHGSIGIELEPLFVPLNVSGPNLSFESRVPTDWEMLNCPIIEITLSTWIPADMHQVAPHSNPTRAVDCILTNQRDIWSPTTAPLTAIYPTSDPRCVSSLYVNTFLVHNALTGTHGGISATFTSERHSSVTFET